MHHDSDKLYASVHLNFISKLERRLMEDLARKVIEGDAVKTIVKVQTKWWYHVPDLLLHLLSFYQYRQIYDQNLDFVALEPRLFSLNFKNSWV